MPHPDPHHQNHAHLTTRIAAAMIACASLAAGPASAQVVYDNGGANSFDGVANDTLYVRDDTGGNPTHLDILDGAELNGSSESLSVEGHSSVTMHGGVVTNNIEVSDNGRLTFYGGEAEDVYLWDDNHAIINGDTVEILYLDVGSDSVVDFFAGSLRSLSVWEQATLNFYGGKLDSGVLASDQTVVNLYGGSNIGGSVRTTYTATVNIFGGQFGSLWTSDSGQIVLYGDDFQLNGADVGFGEIDAASGVLSGYLSDGTYFSRSFERSTDPDGVVLGSIKLVYQPVPEPASLALLGLGGWTLLGRRRPAMRR